MLSISKTEEWAFFFFFIGGNIIIFNAIVGFIVKFVAGPSMYFLDGFGLFDFAVTGVGVNWPFIVGGIINILIGIIALLAGLKIFVKVFYDFMIKIDVAVTGLVLMFLGLGTFTIGGLLLVVGGIYCFIFRLTVEGANNPKGN